MIETSCPHCGKAYRLKPELAGRKARCRNCSMMFLVQDDELDDLEMVSVAVEAYRPPARPERFEPNRIAPAGIDFSAGHEADDDDDDPDEAGFDSAPGPRSRAINRPPAWQNGKRRVSKGPQVPVWVIAGVPAAIAVAALFVFFVVPMIKGPSIAEITGLDEALVAQFEMADDPPLGSPAPPDMKPLVGPPVRDLSANQLIFDDLIAVMEEYRQKLSGVKDFGTYAVVIDFVEKSLKPRTSQLTQEQSSMPRVLTKKENTLMRDHYLRYVKVFDEVLGEFDRIRKIPESEDIPIDEAYLSQLRTFKNMLEKEFTNMEPVVDTRPEGDPAKYAELRVVGTDTPEMKALFEARLFARHPLKYLKIRQNGSAPTRYSVWPIDDVAAFSRGIDAGRVVHVTGRDVWIVVEPLSPVKAEEERVKAVEYRKKYMLSEADKIRNLRASRSRIDQEIAKSLEPPSVNDSESAASPSMSSNMDMARRSRSPRSGEPGRRITNSSNLPGIPGNSGGAAAGLQPTQVEGTQGRGATLGESSSAVKGVAARSRVDKAQVENVAGQKDAFAVAMERIRNVNDQDNSEFGMAILLKIDLNGREKEIYKALGPYLDSPFEDKAAIALAVLERIDDPGRVDEVVRRLGKHRQTDPLFCGMLAKWKDVRAIEPLANQLDGFPLWKHFDNALIAFGPAAEKAVTAKLAATDKNTRKRACEILGEIGGEESLKIFGKLKPDSDPFVRMAANTAITNIRNRLGKPAGRRAGR